MAVITLPSAFKIREIEWDLSQPSQVNRSQWSGADQVEEETWHSRWRAAVTFAPLGSDARLLRSLIAKLKGRVNTIRLPVTSEDQHSIVTPQRVYGAHAAGATTLYTYGWHAVLPSLLDGHFLTINDQMAMVTEDAAPPGVGEIGTGEPGARKFTLHAPLRAAATHSTQITTLRPTCLMALAEDVAGWKTDVGKISSFSLAFEERY